jgi:hypothetical protein
VEILQALREDEEAARPVRSPAAVRQQRYRDSQKASRGITERNAVADGDERDARDAQASPAPSSLSPSPQTPLPHTHTPPESSTRGRVRPAHAKPNGFARFWEAYPNKVGKTAAERSYERALRAIEDPDPGGVILAGLERAKNSRAWREGFIPHPTTWLNQGRWSDEPAEVIPLHPEAPAHGQPPRSDFPTRRQRNLDTMLRGAMAALDES